MKPRSSDDSNEEVMFFVSRAAKVRAIACALSKLADARSQSHSSRSPTQRCEGAGSYSPSVQLELSPPLPGAFDRLEQSFLKAAQQFMASCPTPLADREYRGESLRTPEVM